MDRTYHLYISHSWLCHQDACKKKKIFLERSGIKYKFIETFNQNNEESEELLIEKAIKFCDCLLMIAGVEKKCDIKLEIELNFAKKHLKPVIAIAPWKNKETNDLLKEHAHKIVGWHAKSLADAIKEPYEK